MGLLLVRYVGEIGIKGKNRAFFVRRLRRNMRDALKKNGLEGKVWSERQRMFVQVEKDQEQAIAALQRVFGIASLSPVTRADCDLDAIQQEALALAQRVGLGPDHRFHIRARRSDKTFPVQSPDINRIVGGAVQKATQATVDLSDQADLKIGIEVHKDETLVYGQVFPGPRGMPLNTQGRAFVLISGGIDSPVAAWLMMRRGCGIIPIHFAQNEQEKNKVLEHCLVLDRWSFGWQIKPILLDHHQILEPIANRLYQIGQERWTCIFCKRAMLAKATELAPQYHVQALVMGDSLGQVASQTLDNLVTISWQTSLPILRPLIAYDKEEIVRLARQIGTYCVSVQHASGCSFLPARPITRADPERLQDIMGQLADQASHP